MQLFLFYCSQLWRSQREAEFCLSKSGAAFDKIQVNSKVCFPYCIRFETELDFSPQLKCLRVSPPENIFKRWFTCSISSSPPCYEGLKPSKMRFYWWRMESPIRFLRYLNEWWQSYDWTSNNLSSNHTKVYVGCGESGRDQLPSLPGRKSEAVRKQKN